MRYIFLILLLPAIAHADGCYKLTDSQECLEENIECYGDYRFNIRAHGIPVGNICNYLVGLAYKYLEADNRAIGNQRDLSRARRQYQKLLQKYRQLERENRCRH